jgi:flagellar basal-body rod modification protein FlgD
MNIYGENLRAASAKVAQSLTPESAAAGSTSAVSSHKAQAASSTSSTSGAAAAGSDITSNDFLTLLVTEMKNQDPTQPTDPNAYIQQLVGVNSLQQLIGINQELGTATSGGTNSTAAAVGPVSSTSASAVAAMPSVNNDF